MWNALLNSDTLFIVALVSATVSGASFILRERTYDYGYRPFTSRALAEENDRLRHDLSLESWRKQFFAYVSIGSLAVSTASFIGALLLV